MVIKRHLCGYHIAYEEAGPIPQENKLSFNGGAVNGSNGREQGSHYSQQKKRIADAVARLQQTARPDCRPLIFVATSPGFIDRANEPKFISKLVHNLRNGYKMERYIWVREFTGNGFPHFHFVANIPLKKRKANKFYVNKGKTEIPFNPKELSAYWAGLFGVTDNNNSIRVGSKPKPGRAKMVYLSNNRRKAWYLAKYIGKSRSQDEIRTGAKIKAFHMDEKTSAEIEPDLFRSRNLTYTKAITVWNNARRAFETEYHEFPTGERIWENEKGELMCAQNIDWKQVPGHQCWTGFEKETLN